LAYSIPADASSERAFPGLYSQRSKIYLRTEVSAPAHIKVSMYPILI
jgi:hypothetical protein